VHPSASRRSVIWWAGHRGGLALRDLDRGVVGTVGLSQSLAALNPSLVASVRPHRFGLMLEGEAWKAQLHPEHPWRTASFEALRWINATVSRVVVRASRAIYGVLPDTTARSRVADVERLGAPSEQLLLAEKVPPGVPTV
jgi:hypothetical protein